MSDTTETRRIVGCGANQSHLYYVEPDSEADTKLKGRKYLNPNTECPDCIEDKKMQLERDSLMCDCQFTPDAELCQNGCSYLKEANELPDDMRGLSWVPGDRSNNYDTGDQVGYQLSPPLAPPSREKHS